MFAIKLTRENLDKISYAVTDWTPEDLEDLLNDALDIEDGFVRYMIPNYESLGGWVGSVALIAEVLESDFNYDPSETDWFEITRK